MRTARNIAIVLLLALIFDLVPGGGNAAEAILAAVSILFLAMIGWTGYVFYRQNRLTYLGLTDRQRALLVGSLGAIVLMIAGASELTGDRRRHLHLDRRPRARGPDDRPGRDRSTLELLTRPARPVAESAPSSRNP